MANKEVYVNHTETGLTTLYIRLKHPTAATYLAAADGTFAARPLVFPYLAESAIDKKKYSIVITGAMVDGAFPYEIFKRAGVGQDEIADSLEADGILHVENDAEKTILETASQDAAAVVEGAVTRRTLFRVLLALVAGKTSGARTSTIVFKDQTGAADRLTITADSNGDRTATTINGGA